MTIKKDLIPCSDPALLDYLKRQERTIDQLLKKNKDLGVRIRNVETFLDGQKRKGMKFVKLDLENIDENDLDG